MARKKQEIFLYNVLEVCLEKQLPSNIIELQPMVLSKMHLSFSQVNSTHAAVRSCIDQQFMNLIESHVSEDALKATDVC
jgi:hypothetical protein